MTVPFKYPRHIEAEPRLSDMLSDPTLHALMARDGVDRTTLERLVAATRQRLALPVPLSTPEAFEAVLFAECRNV